MLHPSSEEALRPQDLTARNKKLGAPHLAPQACLLEAPGQALVTKIDEGIANPLSMPTIHGEVKKVLGSVDWWMRKFRGLVSRGATRFCAGRGVSVWRGRGWTSETPGTKRVTRSTLRRGLGFRVDPEVGRRNNPGPPTTRRRSFVHVDRPMRSPIVRHRW